MANRRKTILVVEDSPTQATALKLHLEQKGLQVLRARDGRVGVAMAERYLPDVIVLDVQMQEMDGLEACQQLKHNPRTANIPIVMFTSHNESSLVKQAIDSGVIDYIPKDVFADIVLLETLRELNIWDDATRETSAEG